MRSAPLRKALYYRFHGLLPLVNNPNARATVRGFWRGLLLSFWLIYFAFIALILALRYSILPNIEAYRADIEKFATQTLGQPVSIGRVEASWDGINPDLTLLDVRVADAQGRPALAFARVETILSWWSVPRAQLRLRLLRIDEPTLNLRRDAAGNFSIAGMPIGPSDDKDSGNAADWVLEQRRIRIRGATLVWEDELRQAPPLVLEDVNFALDNDGRQHRFGLTALPPAAFAAPIDIRGDFRGSNVEQLAAWSGQAYLEIDYADLAVWRQWIDYPLALPHGVGALRAWFDLADGRPQAITTDIALRHARLRLAPELPALELDHLSGRVSVRLNAGGFDLDAQQLQLLTPPQGSSAAGIPAAIDIGPTDFQVSWQNGEVASPAHATNVKSGTISTVDSGGKQLPAGAGSIKASRLDIGALAALAGHFPLDAKSRALLSEHAPKGIVSGLSGRWTGGVAGLQSYALKATFRDLAVRAQGDFPGFSGLSGEMEVSEKGGKAEIQSTKSTIDLPAVFPVSLIELDWLKASTQWSLKDGRLEARLAHVDFAGPEAAGSAQGLYRTTADGPGYVDMTAALTRAGAKAVWRYMPHEVGEGARFWLRDSLLAGTTNDAKLVLKGDLAEFPFLDKSKGQFLVTVKARDVVLDYGTGWPRIDGIHGDLRFEGNGMVIDAQRGTILGAKLSNTHVEIPDFDRPISTLYVKGQADGPTAEFLKFIDKSPVAERIDHFTDDMRASGNGHLDIKLTIPLDEKQLPQSRIDGDFRFINNEVTVDAALPPIRQVNGNVQFSGSDLRVPEINGTLFGGPLKIKGGLQKDGNVLITAEGSIDITQLRQQLTSPLLDSFSGSAPYRGEVRINKRNADLVINSTLVGLASALPEPFAKAAAETLPLRFEKVLIAKDVATRAPFAVRDQLNATLGNRLSLQIVRRKQADGFVIERGAIAVGQPVGDSLQLPERGVALAVTAKGLDLDRWRSLLASSVATDGADKSGTSPAPAVPVINTVRLKAGDLILLGHHFHGVELTAAAAPAAWTVRVNSQQATGELLWESAGRGKLSARFKKMVLDQPVSASAGDRVSARAVPATSATSDAVKELPALDLIADEFQFGERRLGRLELQAVNEGNAWRLDRILASSLPGTLSGSGIWQIGGGRSRTELDFKIDSSDVGKLLDRLGYPGTVKSGTARLGGQVGWNGSPASLDFASLSGDMNLEVSKGQFLKLDPGATGKLLGLISLQGLPRRISLDFKDVFSEGFAFDSISSKLAVQGGIMRTERLQIDGPSARVLMRGEVDLEQETQRLNVTVQPELGGTAALGVALINPVAGVATWLAHKVLQNPLNQIFGFDYLVTGTWGDPIVEKVAGGRPPVNPSSQSPPASSANSSGEANEASIK